MYLGGGGALAASTVGAFAGACIGVFLMAVVVEGAGLDGKGGIGTEGIATRKHCAPPSWGGGEDGGGTAAAKTQTQGTVLLQDEDLEGPRGGREGCFRFGGGEWTEASVVVLASVWGSIPRSTHPSPGRHKAGLARRRD